MPGDSNSLAAMSSGILTLGADAFKQHSGQFVGRVLRRQIASDGGAKVVLAGYRFVLCLWNVPHAFTNGDDGGARSENERGCG